MKNQKKDITDNNTNTDHLVSASEDEKYGYTLWNMPHDKWKKWVDSIQWEEIVKSIEDISIDQVKIDQVREEFNKSEAKKILDKENEKRNQFNPDVLNIYLD